MIVVIYNKEGSLKARLKNLNDILEKCLFAGIFNSGLGKEMGFGLIFNKKSSKKI